MDIHRIKNLGELKMSNYASRSIKAELRENLLHKLRKGEQVFNGVLGYEDTVLPEIERAILSGHSINLLGLRGQAKTRIARAMVSLLDEYIPVVDGTILNDDPFYPISFQAREMITKLKDETPVKWLHRSERYTEKLATPDVSVADLIGDVDPIKAATLKLHYSDERVIHFGLVPNANRGIFVINELPDLQARIQVALFNILQEGDIQIRGFKLRLPLDIQFVFTANPEDYTNRGAIITPLKDRIQSQIITHYPKSMEVSKAITKQEAKITKEQQNTANVPELLEDLLERISFAARESEYIDSKSGVSARLTISAYEILHSSIERRVLLNNEENGRGRIMDLYSVVPAITGKVELVYEGEQEGAVGVAHQLIGQVLRNEFLQLFPNPELIRRKKLDNPYETIINWFNNNEISLLKDASENAHRKALMSVSGLEAVVKKYFPNTDDANKYFMMEFVLHALSEFSLISKHELTKGLAFRDILNAVFNTKDEDYD